MSRFIQLASFFLLTSLLAMTAAQAADPARPPSLKTIPVPEPSNLGDFITDKQQAIALGKALFWEMRVGSDGMTACASCHFNAGVDSRSNNQVNPGSPRVHADGSPDPDIAFDFGPNRQLAAGDFPFRQLSDVLDRSSAPVFDSNDIVTSQGVFAADFIATEAGKSKDKVAYKPDVDGFMFDNKNVRRAAQRNAPSVINSVFNFRNFFDGRAQNDFNGINNWGNRDPDAKVFKALTPAQVEAVQISLNNASLASQAVAPPLSDREMSASGRSLPDIGRKLLRMSPLALQKVHNTDSVLGNVSRYPQKGLKIRSYSDMVKAAFNPQWWNSPKMIRTAKDAPTIIVDRKDREDEDYSLMEYNFSLFFGLAIQLYESTLVADDSPYDRFMIGDASAVSEAAVRGVDVFRSQSRGRCINCHEGAELTGASVTRVAASPIRIRDEQALDRGFNNIGVRPSTDDVGIGGTDPFGNPLANIRRAATVPTCANGLPCPVVADGFMKVPGLRNVELTAPYFHNGGTLTLRDVLDFYSRGGDFAKLEQLDGSEIAPLNILMNDDQEKADLEAFLLSLTDERVRHQKAPFDHPQLFVTNGHKLESGEPGNAKDKFIEIKAVGRDGGLPLMGFMQ
ncbi:cytochrome c peroxidase [Methyloglobulus sp.]|uniref:cytochrome-c peroxidase n=1 Tax=Methyloglobulus sp. TaxID=2518622 RepID=UPI0032B71B08